MSLMDLYGNVPGMQRRPDWMNYEGGASPSMSLAVPDQGAVNYYASQPRQEPKKGGGLGEVLKTLFAGALDGVAKHYGFEPGGLNMMKHRMEQEEERKSLMEKLMAERDNYVWKKGVDQQFEGPPELPTSVQEANWLNDPRRTPQERQAYFQAKGPTLVVSNGNTQAYNRDGTPYGGAVPTAPVGSLTPLPEGGGGSDVTGNFRYPIPRR